MGLHQQGREPPIDRDMEMQAVQQSKNRPPGICMLNMKQNMPKIYQYMYGLLLFCINMGLTYLLTTLDGWVQGLIAVAIVAIFGVLCMLLFFRQKKVSNSFVQSFLFFTLSSLMVSVPTSLISSFFYQKSLRRHYDIEIGVTIGAIASFSSARQFEFDDVYIITEQRVDVFTNTSTGCARASADGFTPEPCSHPVICLIPLSDQPAPWPAQSTPTTWLQCHSPCPSTSTLNAGQAWSCDDFPTQFTSTQPVPIETASRVLYFAWDTHLRSQASDIHSLVLPQTFVITQPNDERATRKEARTIALIVLVIPFVFWNVVCILVLVHFHRQVHRSYSEERERARRWRERKSARLELNANYKGNDNNAPPYNYRKVQFEATHDTTFFSGDSAAHRLLDEHRSLVSELFGFQKGRRRYSPPPSTDGSSTNDDDSDTDSGASSSTGPDDDSDSESESLSSYSGESYSMSLSSTMTTSSDGSGSRTEASSSSSSGES